MRISDWSSDVCSSDLPVLAEQPSLTPRAHAKLLNYIQNGGTVLFDTRDQGAVGGTLDLGAQLVTPEGEKLREILRGVNLPALTPVPPDHVPTKAFYLLNDFPGRWTGDRKSTRLNSSHQ